MIHSSLFPHRSWLSLVMLIAFLWLATAVAQAGSNDVGTHITIPQVPFCGAWSTTVYVNPEASGTAVGTYYIETGAPGGATSTSVLPAVSLTLTQGVEQSWQVPCPGNSPITMQGFLDIVSKVPLSASAIFTQAGQSGTAIGTTGSTDWEIPVDNTNGKTVTIAIDNPSPTAMSYFLSFLSSQGATPTVSVPVTLLGYSHTAFVTGTQIPETTGTSGTLFLSAPQPLNLLSLSFIGSGFTTNQVFGSDSPLAIGTGQTPVPGGLYAGLGSLGLTTGPTANAVYMPVTVGLSGATLAGQIGVYSIAGNSTSSPFAGTVTGGLIIFSPTLMPFYTPTGCPLTIQSGSATFTNSQLVGTVALAYGNTALCGSNVGATVPVSFSLTQGLNRYTGLVTPAGSSSSPPGAFVDFTQSANGNFFGAIGYGPTPAPSIFSGTSNGDTYTFTVVQGSNIGSTFTANRLGDLVTGGVPGGGGGSWLAVRIQNQ